MGYQPNDFVNPNQRGVELPAGCKDLMDVLKMGGSSPPVDVRQRFWSGLLSEVEQRVEAFLESGVAQWYLSVGNSQRSASLLMRREGLTLNFAAPVKQESVIRRIFENLK